jgi:hypothetical protein
MTLYELESTLSFDKRHLFKGRFLDVLNKENS